MSRSPHPSMVARVTTATVDAITGRPVTVEAAVSDGLPAFTIVGAPDRAASETRQRLGQAFAAAGVEFPAGRVVVNIAPAHQRANAADSLDLAVAVAVAAASGHTDPDRAAGCGVLGALTSSGELAALSRGALPAAEALHASDLDLIVAAPGMSADIALAGAADKTVRARTLTETLAAIAGHPAASPSASPAASRQAARPDVDLADIRGHAEVIDAMTVAAAGGHNLLLVGSPGTGKTMLARRLPGLLGDLDTLEALEVARIHSAAGLRNPADPPPAARPFRAPHHTVSITGLVGGGNSFAPGEITLADNGVLFLDDVDEFPRTNMQALRAVLTDGHVTLARGSRVRDLPARCTLVAGADVPDSTARARRLNEIADLFDIIVTLDRPGPDDLAAPPHTSTARAREQVEAARARRDDVKPGPATNGRTVSDRTARVARTLAALDGSDTVTARHVAAAQRLRAPITPAD